MLKLFVFILSWVLALWYLYDYYNEIRSLNKSVIGMLHSLKIGICDNRRTINEIIANDSIFSDNQAKDFSMFLWENHEKLGLSSELIDRYNAFTKESEFGDGHTCEEGIIALEEEFKAALNDNQVRIKSRFISIVTMCTAAFAVILILLV